MVHHMSKLMEKCDNLTMLEERRLSILWWIEICYHCSGSWQNLTIDLSSLCKPKGSSMIIFIRSWVKVKIKMAKQLFRLLVFDLIARYLWMPSLRFWKLAELKTKELLIDIHRRIFHVLGREVFLKLLFVEIELLLFQFASEKPGVPFMPNSIRVVGLVLLELDQLLLVLLSSIDESSDQIIFKNLYILR